MFWLCASERLGYPSSTNRKREETRSGRPSALPRGIASGTVRGGVSKARRRYFFTARLALRCTYKKGLPPKSMPLMLIRQLCAVVMTSL